jgi:hypothetical protein
MMLGHPGRVEPQLLGGDEQLYVVAVQLSRFTGPVQVG